MTPLHKHTHLLLLALLFLLALTLVACTTDTGTSDTTAVETIGTVPVPETTEAPTEPATEAPTDAPTEAPTAPPTEAPTEPETEPQPEPPYTLRIGSYNIKHGAGVNFSMRLLGCDIKDLGLDIVGLQEVDQFADRSQNQDTIKEIANGAGLEYYTFFKAIDLPGGAYGVGILSRFPILESSVTQLGSGDKEQRVAGRVVLDVYGTRVTVFVTHLAHDSKELRDAQMAEVAALAAVEENYLVMGDFNTHEFADFAPFTSAGATLLNNADYSVPTFPAYETAIDNIIYSPDWTCQKPETFDEGHSDHRLLYTEAVFAPATAGN